MKNNTDLSFLKKLINEAITEMGYNNMSKSKNNSSYDELEDLEDEYDYADAQSTDQSTPEKKEQGWFYKQNKNNPGVIKGISDQQLDRLRKGLPTNEYLGAEWNEKPNAVQKDILNPDRYGRIKVMVSPPSKVQAYEYPIVVITLLNIDVEDCKNIKSNFQKIGHTERVNVAKTRDGLKSAGVSFIIAEKYLQSWINDDLEKVIMFLSSIKDENGNSKYFSNEQEMQNLRDYVINRSVTSKDFGDLIATSHKNNIELFNAFIAAENDSEVQELIKMYQRFGLVNQLCAELGVPVSFGKILTFQNASLVLGSKKLTGAGVTPTFIMTENMWYRMFRRRVKPNGVPFYIFVPHIRHTINKNKEQKFTSKPYTLKDKDGNDVEISSTSDVLNKLYFGKTWEELSPQQKIAASQMCNYINPSKCFPMAEFDVSDTELLDPNDEDIFANEMGMVNRFTGELNQAAMNFVRQQGIMDPENKNGEQGNGSDDDNDGTDDAFKIMSDKINELALRNISEYCDAEGIQFTLNKDDVSQSIINALHNIATKHIPLRKKENIEILVGDAVYMACILHRIALDLVKSIKRGRPTDNVEATQCIDAFVVLSSAIEGSWKNSYKDGNTQKMVAEAENDEDTLIRKYTPQQLKNYAIKMLQLNESAYGAYNNFNLLLERMDNSKNNRK